jgi:hypothetical protein
MGSAIMTDKVNGVARSIKSLLGNHRPNIDE